MEGARKLALALALTTLLAAGLIACGGDSDDSSTATGSAATTREEPSSGSGASADQGSAAFRTPGGDNSIQNFGEEADAAEVEAADAALAAYMQARAEDDWAGQCADLAQAAVAPLEELASRSPQLKGKGCAAVLEGLMAGTPKSTRANTMTAGLSSLRFEDDRAFALYHGAKGIDYFVPMAQEDGEWKVGALVPTEFP